MADLRMVVCMKAVPKPEEIRVNPQTNLLERANVRTELNPPDMNALEIALALKDKHGGHVEILSMGPPSFEPYLRVSLSMGADHATLLSDRAFGGADTLATTYTLAQGIRRMNGVDLVLCGEESSDGATGQVPQGLAEWLGWAQLTLVTEMEIDAMQAIARGKRSIKGGYELLEVPLPCVVSVKTACNEPRFMDFRRSVIAHASGSLTVWNAEDIQAAPELCGLKGSPTAVTGLAAAALRERKNQFLTGTNEAIISRLVEIIRQSQ